MKTYDSLFKLFKTQPIDRVFAYFYPVKLPNGTLDYDEHFRNIARYTIDGYKAWEFHHQRFQDKYSNAVPKLRNYLNYTFLRLQTLEQGSPGRYFLSTEDQEWICFNTGLQNTNSIDLIAIFERNRRRHVDNDQALSDWVYKGCYPANDSRYRLYFGTATPDIAWYSTDGRDFVFDLTYSLDRDSFDHLFERAKERSGLPNASDEVVRNYLRGAIENLIPKISRNYKVAIPVYYVEEQRMQLLLPFA